MTPIMIAAIEAMRVESKPMLERGHEGVWVRYPDRRRRGRGHDVFNVAHVTLKALARRGLVFYARKRWYVLRKSNP